MPDDERWPEIENLEIEGKGCYLRISVDENVKRDKPELQARFWEVLRALGYVDGPVPKRAEEG